MIFTQFLRKQKQKHYINRPLLIDTHFISNSQTLKILKISRVIKIKKVNKQKNKIRDY